LRSGQLLVEIADQLDNLCFETTDPFKSRPWLPKDNNFDKIIKHFSRTDAGGNSSGRKFEDYSSDNKSGGK
jgi:hypothetical protein